MTDWLAGWFTCQENGKSRNKCNKVEEKIPFLKRTFDQDIVKQQIWEQTW